MLLQRSLEMTLTIAFALVLTGCTGGDSTYTEVSHDESELATDDHGHGSHGPNGGDIVELGNEEFHAEFVVDEAAHRMDVYILGSDAKTAKPIEATEISLGFKHGEAVEEFKLAAAPLEGEPEGQSSKFTLADAEAFGELHEHPEGATLSIAAGEVSLTGTVKHSHDHGDGHDDDHGDGHGGEHGDDDDDHGKHPAGDDDGGGHKHGKGHDDDGDEHGKKGDKADGDKADSDNGPVKPADEPAKAADSTSELAAEKDVKAESAVEDAKKE